MTFTSTKPPLDTSQKRFSLAGLRSGYWMLCSIEMFERLAYFLVRSVVAVEPTGMAIEEDCPFS
jgi:hypothetical protein